MEIVDFGFFQSVEGEDDGIVYFVNEDGHDWYEMRFGLTSWRPQDGRFINAVYGAWALVDADGVVTSVEYDPSRLMPGNRRILGIDADRGDIKPGMVWRDGELSAGETAI